MASAGLIWLAPLLGLIVGSFLGALSYRLPRGKSVAEGRSQCPSCHTPLQIIDLVPVLSWVAMGGKCRHCGARVSPRYPLIEASTALVFLCAAGMGGPAWQIGLTALAGAFGILIVTLWLEHRVMPIAIVIPSLVLACGAILSALLT